MPALTGGHSSFPGYLGHIRRLVSRVYPINLGLDRHGIWYKGQNGASSDFYKRTISVQFYLRLAACNRRGYYPVRMTLRWHGEELQMDAGVLVLPERPGSNVQGEALWDVKAQRAVDGRKHRTCGRTK